MPRRPALLDVAPRLSDTHARIHAVVRRIPRGKVATYGQVAELAGFGGHARLAGYALHALPEGTPLPWHRVLGAGGRLTLVKLSLGAATTQRLRLEGEGVRFDARGRVDLDVWRWRPRATGAPKSKAARGRTRRLQGLELVPERVEDPVILESRRGLLKRADCHPFEHGYLTKTCLDRFGSDEHRPAGSVIVVVREGA